MTSIDEAVRTELVCAGCAHTPGVSRRRVLEGGAALMGVGVLAACGANGGGTQGGSGEGSAEQGDGGGDGADDGATGLVALADVPVGGAVLVAGSAGDVIVAQPEEGAAVAFSAVCTHQGCTVEVDGAELVCPCHGSVFEAVTGEYVSGPAPRGLDEVPVEVRDGQVVGA